VSFAVAADAYDRFMGRYSRPLAPHLADLAGIEPGWHALDVGCGAGALTTELVRRLGSASVAAVDPSPSFVAAVGERFPAVDVRQAQAEHLPFTPGTFDAALAQLVVHFMADPVAGLGEMARVTRRGGVVAACVWDHAGGGSPLSAFWEAVRRFDPTIEDEADRAGAREGHLGELFSKAGLAGLEETVLSVTVDHPTFEEWWEPFELGVGPSGAYTAGLDETRRIALRELCRETLPPAPFSVTGRAWAVRGAVP